MLFSQLQTNYHLKLKEFPDSDDPKIMSKNRINRDKYTNVYNYLKNKITASSKLEPREVYQAISQNENWNTLNTRLDKFKIITTLIGMSDKILHKKFLEYRKDNLEGELFSENKNRSLKLDTDRILIGDERYGAFIIRLYRDYPPLRSDYATVKLKDFNTEKDNYYQNGVIYFHTLIKNQPKEVFQVVLKGEDTQFLEKFKLYNNLLFPNDSKNPIVAFQTFLKRTSEKLLGVSVSINDFRRQYFTKTVKEADALKFIEGYSLLRSVAKKSNTSIEAIVNYYYSDEKKNYED